MLDQKSLEIFKNRLLKDQSKTKEELSKMTEGEDGIVYMDNYGDKEEDNAEEVSNYYSKIQIAKTLKNKLNEIKKALERIEDGTFGVCENCPDQKIPIERLKAKPTATTCLNCKK